MKIPNKKISLVILFTAIVVVITILSSSQKNRVAQSDAIVIPSSVSISMSQNISNVTLLDSDGDGLLDWEEDLWGTDKYNPDTDGDGTSDGAEVAAGRNPTIPGPDDSLKEKNDEMIEALEEKWANVSGLTQQMSRELSEEYFSIISESGVGLSYNQKKNLVEEMVENIINTREIKNKYNRNILLTFSEIREKQKLLKYANAVMEVEKEFKNILLKKSSNEIIASTTKKMAEILISIETPENLADYHTALANGYNHIGTAFEWINMETTDPIVSLMGLSLLAKSSEMITNNWSAIVQYLRNNGIIFDGNNFYIVNTYE